MNKLDYGGDKDIADKNCRFYYLRTYDIWYQDTIFSTIKVSPSVRDS